MKKWPAYLSLFGSLSTLICCALPALLVALGLGAALAGLLNAFPQIVWLSRHKAEVFGGAAIVLAAAGWMQWRARYEPCPADPTQAAACRSARRFSGIIYVVSVGIYALGAFFAFGFRAA